MPNLPQQLLNSLSALKGFNEEAFTEVHNAPHKLTSIRLNPFKTVALDFEIGQKVAWNDSGFYLNQRPYFTHDPLFHAGCYYVQEAGSMFLELALRQHLDLTQQLNVLDLCAAPGGKSTLINSLISEDSLLVANETVKSRADILAQNLGRWGTANSVVTNNTAEKFEQLPSFFDVLVIDAPCSGSGLFRKQPEAINEWSENAVKQCSVRQKNILEQSLACLKDGGLLFYSTCSYSEDENEEIVKWLVNTKGLEYLPLSVNTSWGIVETDFGYRFYPHLLQSEGFFCAIMRKGRPERGADKITGTATNVNKADLKLLEEFLKPSVNAVHSINNRLHLGNQAVLSFVKRFDKNFYFKKAGTLIGEMKGGKLVPEQELAWSNYLAQHVARINLERESAINFLRKENFLSSYNNQNLALITYKHFGLGWAKILANRANNYLPNELRVLR